MPDKTGLTTEIFIPADNAILAELLHDRYSRMERGEVRAELESLYGHVWGEEELQQQYAVDWCKAPYAHVVRRADGKHCTLAYTENPRFYFLLHCEEADE
jgi:hypothetical protein